jgi:RING finger/CHY zinc finger protein 1
MSGDCPICMEDMFKSREQSVFLNCGHAMHQKCFKELARHKYQCPLCFKSFCNMSQQHKQLDSEIESMPMPAELASRTVNIYCNDCNQHSVCGYHILGAKCVYC